MGIPIPESARIVLLQEDKFKNYYNLLVAAHARPAPEPVAPLGQAREQADRLGAEGALRPAPRPLDHGHAGVSRREQDGVLHVPVLQGAAADRPQLRDERRPARRGEPEQVGAARRGAADFDGVGGPRKLERPVTREVKPRTPCGIRTHDPWIRSPVPYPLGQWGVHPMWGSNPRPPV